MKLSQFYKLLNSEAFITLAVADLSKIFFEGEVKAIPNDYESFTVKDFCISDQGDYLFKVTAPAHVESNGVWKEGRIEVRGITFHYWAKVYEEGSKFGIDGGRISKLTIRNERTNAEVVNYDRGWDIEPKTKSAKEVLDMVLRSYN